jgi:hypothetical protein
MPGCFYVVTALETLPFLCNEFSPEKVHKAEGKFFCLVLDFSMTGAPYVDPAIDITDEVIQRYDETKSSAK